MPGKPGRNPEKGHRLHAMKTSKILLTALALAATTAALSAADASGIWDSKCKSCQGADGTGATPMGKKLGLKDFTDAKVQADMKDDAMLKAIKEGVKDGDKTRMKAVEGLSDEEMKDLVAYVRKFKK